MPHSGIRRNCGPGTDGRAVQIITNAFPVEDVPGDNIYHYDAIDGQYNRRRKLEIMDKLQIQYASMFNPRAAYDGEKNIFRTKPLNLPNNAGKFEVYLNGNVDEARRKQAKCVIVMIKQVARIDPRSLLAVLKGEREAKMGSEQLTTMTFLNILIRMKPILTHPSNSRSFFVEEGRDLSIGRGLELWRGYFQSVRLSIGRLIVNVDIATAVMYQGGPLIEVVKAYLGLRDSIDLTPERMNDRTIRILENFLKGLLVCSTLPRVSPGGKIKYRPIKCIERSGADWYKFDCDGAQCTISEHFRRTYNYSVLFGRIICVGLSTTKKVVYPLEVLVVKPGQFYKKKLTSVETAQTLKFSTLRPQHRLAAIEKSNGPDILGYNESDYLRFSGMRIGGRPIHIPARVLPALKIRYGNNFEETPNKGVWNFVNRKLVEPRDVTSWVVLVFDRQARPDEVERFALAVRSACRTLGMGFTSTKPPFIMANPQGNFDSLAQQLDKASRAARDVYNGEKPTFILVVLPEFAPETISAVKHWGDCRQGCPTQCVRRDKMQRANDQYWNNVALKINIRIGGVNWYPSGSLQAVKYLASVPTMVVGADVSHAAPDSDRPSVAGLVSSVDTNMCRYVATTSVQESRLETITDLGDMTAHAISMFNRYQMSVLKQNINPQRILFYRDGLSEGQFDVVARHEIGLIKEVLKKLRIDAKLVYIVVGKNHHFRFFPTRREDADKSGNCEAGLVVDQVIVHPIEYDFYLQSHTGLLGTSRSAHYTVIENGVGMFSDALQQISYALCHVYGRATRSVSIPAPVYYADLVCGRGKYHSLLLRDGEDEVTAVTDEEHTLEEHRQAFYQIHPDMATSMYWI